MHQLLTVVMTAALLAGVVLASVVAAWGYRYRHNLTRVVASYRRLQARDRAARQRQRLARPR